ncbi:MAG: type II toxin-antitoxin system VapC family toxin [Chitinispirillia bacterium]
MTYLLDTHTWIWWHMRPQKLSRKVRNLISAVDKYNDMLLSAISPWEFCKFIEKGRLIIACDPEEWIREAMDMPKFRLVHLIPTIAYKSTVLPTHFHDDPAAQIIFATAREENAIIITKDTRIQQYNYVKSIW